MNSTIQVQMCSWYKILEFGSRCKITNAGEQDITPHSSVHFSVSCKQIFICIFQGDAWYNLTGLVLELIPLYGHGAMWLEIYELDLYAKVRFQIHSKGCMKFPYKNFEFISQLCYLAALLNFEGTNCSFCSFSIYSKECY